MSSPMQRASFRRKIGYFVAVLVLFTVSIFWRGKLDMPFSNQLAASQKVNVWTVGNQARRLELTELDQADPEIAGTAARLSLIGVRGPVITFMWWSAIDKQKRNEWHEFELLVRLVTRLQPNFITPWIFQSWNIAYNVSVENDKLADMYFYIARGIELLSEGDRINSKVYQEPNGGEHRLGSPDIRYQIGFYYRNKFGVSDKVQTLRCLMQLSGIRPADRRASTFYVAGTQNDPTPKLDQQRFREFCEKNPQLVRRLRTKLNCTRPEDVVQFLRDNERVPCLYTAESELASPDNQFPVLPRTDMFPEAQDNEFTISPLGSPSRAIDDTFDAFHASRSWFTYANMVVPPNKRERDAEGNETGEPLPWRSPFPGEYNPLIYRMPRSPALVIFRQDPARTQTYLAERLSKEGWFDETSRWNPDERASESSTWFPGQVVNLSTPLTSNTEWDRAWRMWRQQGEQSALALDPLRFAQLSERASRIRTVSGEIPNLTFEQIEAEGIDLRDYEAAWALRYYDQNRSITNFPYYLQSCDAERDPLTISARRLLFEADRARENAENTRAIRLYTQGLAKWREVLAKYPQFHRTERSEKTEEDTYELELNLISLLQEDGTVRARVDRVSEVYGVLFPALMAQEVAKPDILMAVAEDEAGTRIAAEAIETIFPNLPVDAPEQKVLRQLEGVSNASGAFMAALSTSPVRATQTRGLLDSPEFSWMKELKNEPSPITGALATDYWVQPYIREAVKYRLGLIRKIPSSVDTGGEGSAEAQELPTPPGASARPDPGLNK